jgi:hypothetical protein
MIRGEGNKDMQASQVVATRGTTLTRSPNASRSTSCAPRGSPTPSHQLFDYYSFIYPPGCIHKGNLNEILLVSRSLLTRNVKDATSIRIYRNKCQGPRHLWTISRKNIELGTYLSTSLRFIYF